MNLTMQRWQCILPTDGLSDVQRDSTTLVLPRMTIKLCPCGAWATASVLQTSELGSGGSYRDNVYRQRQEAFSISTYREHTITFSDSSEELRYPSLTRTEHASSSLPLRPSTALRRYVG